MAYAELFSVDLDAEPNAELRERMRRYLYFKFPTKNAKAFEPDCAGIARVDSSTQLKLLRPSKGKPWRIVCQSSKPERMTHEPQAAIVASAPVGASLRIARLKPGQQIKAGSAPVEQLKARFLQTVA